MALSTPQPVLHHTCERMDCLLCASEGQGGGPVPFPRLSEIIGCGLMIEGWVGNTDLQGTALRRVILSKLGHCPSHPACVTSGDYVVKRVTSKVVFGQLGQHVELTL